MVILRADTWIKKGGVRKREDEGALGGDLGGDALPKETLRDADAKFLGVAGRRERAVRRAEAGHVTRVGRG